jgi:hypothetical protein
MAEDLQALADEIKALPADQALLLASRLLRQSQERGGDIRLTRMAYTIANRISTELGAALALHDLRERERKRG